MKKKRIMSAVLALFVLSSPLSSLPTSAANTEVSAEVELEAAVDITEEECDINISQDIVIEQEIKISTVPQISDYDAVVYSANNYIPGSYWKPLMEDVPNLEAWVMKNGSYDSAYTGFYDLDNAEPYKPEKWVSRECEIMGYDALVSSEYIRDGKYHALLIDEDSVSRADAIMLLYKALGEYEYDYTITNKSDKGVWVFVSRSNNANYIKRATQDYIVNVYDNNNVPIKAGDFIITAARLMQQYGITVKESRGQLSYLPAGRTKFIRAKHLGDKFDKAAVLATLQANAERKPKAQFKQDTIGKLIDIQSRMTEGKGIGYKRWLTKHNLKVMAQTVKLLQEKDLTDEGALNQRIAELETKYHDSLAVVKDLEGRMKTNNELRYHIAAYTSTKNVAQQLKTAKRPAAFEEQHRAELTAYRAAAAYFKANNITKLPSPKKLEAEYAQLASEKAKFYEQYKEAKEELLKLKTAKQNVASFFREEEPAQQER